MFTKLTEEKFIILRNEVTSTASFDVGSVSSSYHSDFYYKFRSNSFRVVYKHCKDEDGYRGGHPLYVEWRGCLLNLFGKTFLLDYIGFPPIAYFMMLIITYCCTVIESGVFSFIGFLFAALLIFAFFMLYKTKLRIIKQYADEIMAIVLADDNNTGDSSINS